MNNPYILISIAFIIGVFFGAVVVLIIFKILSGKSETRFNAVLNQAAESMKSSFAEISLETIGKTTGIMSETLKSEREVSAKEIAGQKEVIEKRIEVLNGELAKLTALIGSVENSRNMQMGELKSIIDDSRLKTGELMKVTSGLRETLSSKQDRGQWAERMADDILNYAGLKEGINYVRQQKSGATGKRPDFTFMLPNGMLLNMDVKFPYDNYKKYLEAPDNEKHIYAKDFIKDVKSHIKAISGREYIDIENGTVDCALMFIPNEKIYGFIFDTDASVLDEAARQNIIICSPVTAISVLAVIRQAAQNFTIEKKAKELMKAMAAFRKEWIKYSEGFNKLGETINKAAEEYGTLRSTRSNKLESSMRKLEDLKEEEENR